MDETTGDDRLTTVGIGAAAGVGSGLLGVGGGILMVPLLTAVIGLTQHRAHATSLAAIVPIGLVGAVTYAAHGEVDLSLALPLAAGTVVGAPIGARVMARLREGALMVLFGVLLAAVGLRMIAPW